MNGLERITGRISEDARTQAEGILSAARAEADTVTARYDAEVNALSETQKVKGEAAAREHRARMLGSAELEARKSTLATKQDLIGDAFARAGEKLLALPEEKRVGLLARLAAQAARSGSEQICLSKAESNFGDKILPLANKLAAERGLSAALTLSAAPRDFSGGVMLLDGDVEINCTYDTLLRGLRDSIAGEVAAVLFN